MPTQKLTCYLFLLPFSIVPVLWNFVRDLKQDCMKKTTTVLFTGNILDRYMETGLTMLRQNFKKGKYSRLQHLPVNLFGAVMGIAGMALAWRQAAGLWGFTKLIGEWMGVVAIVLFIILAFF
jgi:hypothetical protein